MLEIATRLPDALIREFHPDQLMQNTAEIMIDYMRYDKPPMASDRIDAIVIPTTSPFTAELLYVSRVELAAQYARRYSHVPIIISGGGPPSGKFEPGRIPQDSIEATSVAGDLSARNVDRYRFQIDPVSSSAKDNVENGLAKLIKLFGSIPSAVWITSGYMSRRIEFYLWKQLVERDFQFPPPYFLVDADVREDELRQDFSEQEQENKAYRMKYEWKRLVKYHAKGDL